ncbi:MAG: secondary thiamine-phosphate synthase enzyme YjbQ [Gammaproteobacteria bacterium]
MLKQFSLSIETSGREIIDITQEVNEIIKNHKQEGLCHLFLTHTSASLILCENYDPQVKRDLESFFSRLIQDGDHLFKHVSEGPDDMPAHVRTVLTQNSIAIPISQGKLVLGTWQGICLWEHRNSSHKRTLVITILENDTN